MPRLAKHNPRASMTVGQQELLSAQQRTKGIPRPHRGIKTLPEAIEEIGRLRELIDELVKRFP
jgi:hypothetical protein